MKPKGRDLIERCPRLRQEIAEVGWQLRAWRRWLRMRLRRSPLQTFGRGGWIGWSSWSRPWANRRQEAWRPAAGRALLWGLAAAGAGAALVATGALGLAVARARLEAPAPTRLLLDRQGRFLGEIAAGGDSTRTAQTRRAARARAGGGGSPRGRAASERAVFPPAASRPTAGGGLRNAVRQGGAASHAAGVARAVGAASAAAAPAGDAAWTPRPGAEAGEASPQGDGGSPGGDSGEGGEEERRGAAPDAAADPGLGYWPLDALPPRVVAATLALEDRRFARHPGVDLLAAARALLQDLRSGRRVSGASTLAMQVARLQHPGARGYLRKLSEAATAVLLTSRFGREEVLRHYLRIVPYGNRIHGIAYAARSYFEKPVDDLSWAEIAFLAALPQAPARMNPFLPAGRLRAVERGQRVLAALAARGVLSAAELALARQQLLTLRIPYRERRPPEAMHALLHLGSLLAQSQAAGAPALPTAPIVRTTLDLELQKEVSWMTHRAVRDWESRGAGNASLLVLDLARREVLAWVGSTGYFDAADHGAIDYARVRRSAGSTLKPFLYAQALENGVLQPATILDDLQRGPSGIANADEGFLGPLLPRVALATSRNVPAALLLGRIGLDRGYGLLSELGLTDGALPARHYGLGLAIGGLPVTLEELARAYLVLAGDGRFHELRWARDQALPAPRRMFSEETARLVTLFLSDPQARLPSFPRMGATEYRFAVAVKTGTSTNYHDAWAVAYSTRYLVAAWVGHPGFRAMNHLSGYLSAAELVKRVLLLLHRDQGDGLEDLSFPPPRGFRPVRVCALTGHRATAACDRVFLEWFRPGDEPVDDCTAHQHRAVDRRDGLLATAGTPRQEIEVRAFVELPARYAAWQASARLPRPPDEPSPLGPSESGAPGSGAGNPAKRGEPGGGPPASGTTRRSLEGPAPATTAANRPASVPGQAPGSAAWLAGTGAAAGADGEPAEGDAVSPRQEAVRLRAGAPVHLRITSPENGARLLRDPETPAALSSLALTAVVDPPSNEVVWYVDGRPFATAAYPYSARWRLLPGRHIFQVRLPLSAVVSRPVTVIIE
ncbi:MAG TPA: transglycosylase domain-containing protein [Thermoanaerobaculia bacterium]|nr:transglycosylase domain-containing protein [Thermoanaerobaculia bacterium]